MSGGAFVTEFKRQFEGVKVAEGLEVASEDSNNSSGGFCLRAATDLQPNEPLLSLPFESLLHSNNASNRTSFQRTFEEVMRLLRETDDPGVFEIGRGNQQQNLLEDQDILILILFLIHERAQGEQSPWHSYIKMLPQKISSPLALDPESESDRATLDLLEGSNLLDLIYALQFSLHNIHDTLVAQVPSVASLAFEDFLWAFLIVNSRAFRLVSPIKSNQSQSSTSSSTEDEDEGFKEPKGPEMMTCLIPIADMANHVVFQDQVNFSHSSQFSMTSSSSPSVEFRSTRAVEKGQELRFSYNQLANWQLLVYYGFAVASNPVDGLSITLDSPEEENYETEIKKMLFMSCLEEFSNDHCIPRPNLSDSFSVFDARAVFPSPLIGTLRLLLMDDDEITEFTVTNIHSVLEKAVSDRNEKAVFETLQSIISSMIDLFPTSLDHDLALLPTLSPSDPRFFLTIYLIDQKQILRDVLRAVVSVLSLEQ